MSSFKARMGVRTARPRVLHHIDLCGPLRIQKRGIKIDDFSKYTWTMFRWKKGETAGILIIVAKVVQLKVN